MRRPEPLHPPALLIDQHRSFGNAYRFEGILNQPGDLGFVLDVALEQDEAPWPSLTQECALVRRERKAGQP